MHTGTPSANGLFLAPIQEHRIKHVSNPWFDKNIQASIYNRDYIHKKAIKYKSPALWAKYKDRIHTPRCKAISRTFPGLFQEYLCRFPGPFASREN